MSGSIASFGMYDHPDQQWANDALWSGIARVLREHGVAAPAALDRGRAIEDVWRNPRLLIGQACGYPLVSQPDLRLRVLAVPHYDAPGCSAGEHVSFLVVRADEADDALERYRGRIAAINARHSNTGHNLFRAAVAPYADAGRFFAAVVETGAHRSSVAAVLGGDADIAAIDAVTFAAIRHYEPDLAARLRIIGSTTVSAAPPFVTARSTGAETVAALRIALAAVIADPALADARAALFLSNMAPSGIAPFAALRQIEIDAIAAGYPQLN